jgi:hypothetical protein
VELNYSINLIGLLILHGGILILFYCALLTKIANTYGNNFRKTKLNFQRK